MNDTIAIIGTPVVLALSARSNTQPKILLLALAFAVTIGSVTSPIGNPQNLLIAIHGNVANPFVTFLRYLGLPTLVNLLMAYAILRLFYSSHFHTRLQDHKRVIISDIGMAKIARVSLVLLASLVFVKIALVFTGTGMDLKLTYIALIAALPVLLFSRRRLQILRQIDWHTLLFFASMFILMDSVWNSGYIQKAMTSMGVNLASVSQIIGVSVLLSQLISNVPLVALYLPILTAGGSSVAIMMALTAGSTIAGNLTILGAASNVIIIQNAEKSAGVTLTFWDFVRVGFPLTILNVAVYWLYLTLVV